MPSGLLAAGREAAEPCASKDTLAGPVAICGGFLRGGGKSRVLRAEPARARIRKNNGQVPRLPGVRAN